MSRKMSNQQHSLTPYQLISVLNKKIKTQNQSIEWYKKMLDTSEYEKKITLNELRKKKQALEKLKTQMNLQKEQRKDYEIQLQQLRGKINKIDKFNNFSKTSTLKPSLFFSPNSVSSSKQLLATNIRVPDRPISTILSLQLKNSEVYSIFNPVPMTKILQQKNRNAEQFIPSDIKLISKNHRASFFGNSSGSFLNRSGEFANQAMHDDPISQNPAEFLFQDFLILGPDVSDLKKKRDDDRKASQFLIKPSVLYAGNGKHPNQQTYTQIASRCFPFNSLAKRQFIESYEDLKQIIEFTPHNKISNDCLIFNLKGQVSSSAKSNLCLKRSNLNEIEFIFCVRVPDFILLTKDEKHYQRTEQQVWLIQKYYAVATYYPFFDIHLNVLLKIHAILLKQKLQKILVQKQKFYSFDLRKNMLDFQRNQQVKEIIGYFKSYKTEIGGLIFYKNNYYGTIPKEGFQIEYSIAKLAAPAFLTNFSYEEMLLLLTGLFCQKSLIFTSKDQGTASLCALFLINLLSPFPYSSFIMLNADEAKLAPIIFQYPFPMIATVKKTSENLNQIIGLYATSRIQKKDIKEQAERIILIDIDTNSIFYQGHASFEPLIVQIQPSPQVMQQYMKVNSAFSKSFSFPKKMDQKRENNQFNKKRQERKKIIQDLQHTIKSNSTKSPSFDYTKKMAKVLQMIVQYVRSFALDGLGLSEALSELQTSKYHGTVKRYLLQRHPTKSEVLDKIVNSQYYADYLNLFAQN